MTVAHFEWRYLTGHIIRYFADFQKNRGKAALINKVNSDIDTLQASLTDQLESSLFNDGTADNSQEINGLLNLVAEAPATGTIGSINRASLTTNNSDAKSSFNKGKTCNGYPLQAWELQ